jgi:3D-(3,5/4)-trihydroxycyclohexane-1,2-dione acylhydrolase (decyclizing)
VLRASGIEDFRAKLAQARAHTGGPVLVHVETDPLVPAPSSESWWDVPVAEVARLESTTQARKSYEAAKAAQRPYLDPRG